ncbi:MauE/DoxX family redox-associated membrane protein [Microbacterium bandirmense]|uniref:MauE/DoxX family redox-associated membrane protein n=1 Tax=Microbacterium bandirmense TaxID=3122050 RepID=UPI003077D9E3
MPGPLTVIPPLLLAAVLIASGVAKLRRPDDLAGWADLGVPAVFRRTWLLKFHPWGEIVLGLALALLGGLLGELAAIVALALMIGYLVFVARIVRSGADASCACFGVRKRVTGATITRNAWYVALAATVAATTWANPLWGGPLMALSGDRWLWALGLLAAAITVAITMWPTPEETSTADPGISEVAGAPASDDDLDYIRSRTPAVPVTLAGGELTDLRTLSMTGRPLLALQLNPGCGSCVDVYESLDEIRATLPEVSVRLLLSQDPGDSAWTETGEPESLHDPHRYVSQSIGTSRTPSAVLFGLDGLLAGGPVTGAQEIQSFVGDIYESLHGERPARATSRPSGTPATG